MAGMTKARLSVRDLMLFCLWLVTIVIAFDSGRFTEASRAHSARDRSDSRFQDENLEARR